MNISYRNDEAVHDMDSGSPHDRLIAMTLMLKQATKEKWDLSVTNKRIKHNMIDAMSECYMEYISIFGRDPKKQITDTSKHKM